MPRRAPGWQGLTGQPEHRSCGSASLGRISPKARAVAAVTATVAGSTWFFPLWIVSRPVPSAHSSTSPQVRAAASERLSPPSARTPMMAGSRAARRL